MSVVRRVQDRTNRIRRRRFALTFHGSGGVPPATFITPEDCIKWNTLILQGNEVEGAEGITFFIVQTEKGADDGRVHYQAYVEFKKKTDWSTVRSIFGDRVHMEAARAGSAANIRYCTKNDTRYTGGAICVNGQWGTPRKGGGVMMAAIKVLNGATRDEIIDQHPEIGLLHLGKLESFIAYAKGARTTVPKIIILFGLTGCGKTQYCMKKYGVKDAFWVSPPQGGRVWFGGYYGQDVAIFDEFTSGWFKLTYLLRLWDSTPLMVQPKCREVPFNTGTHVYTSNIDPRDWYTGYSAIREEENATAKQMVRERHMDALERRIQDFAEIYDCTKETRGTPRGPAVIYRQVKRTGTFKFRKARSFSVFDNPSPGNSGFDSGF